MESVKGMSKKALSVALIMAIALIGLALVGTKAYAEEPSGQTYSVEIKNADGSQADGIEVGPSGMDGGPIVTFKKGDDVIGEMTLDEDFIYDEDNNKLTYAMPEGEIVFIKVNYAEANDVPTRLGWFEKSGDQYVLSTDKVCDLNKEYYDACILTEVIWDSVNPSDEGWYEFNGETEEYVETTDEEVASGKTYYESWKKYEQVNPTEGDIPANEGWYEYVESDEEESGSYIITDDEVVDPDKVYYELVNSGYSKVYTSDEGVDPSEEGWYVYDGESESYVLTEDTTVDPDTTYYIMAGDYEPVSIWKDEKEYTDPYDEDWYEYDAEKGEYVATVDHSVNPEKTYFKAKYIGFIEIYVDEKNAEKYYVDSVSIKSGNGIVKEKGDYASIFVTGDIEITVDFKEAVYKNISVKDMTMNSESPRCWTDEAKEVHFYNAYEDVDGEQNSLKGCVGKKIEVSMYSDNAYDVIKEAKVNGKSIIDTLENDTCVSFEMPAQDVEVEITTENAKTVADEAKTSADDLKKAAEDAAKTAAASKAAADEAAKTPGPAAVKAAQKAEADAQLAAAAAAAAKDAADKSKAAAEKVQSIAQQIYDDALEEGEDTTQAKTDLDNAKGDVANAKTAADDAQTAKENADKALSAAKAATAKAVDDNAKTVKTVTVNVKTVNAAAVNKAAAAAGASDKYVTKIVLGKKVKKISKNSFKTYKNVTVLEVKTKKLKKKSVKGSLKGSAVKTVKVSVGKTKANKKYVKKYKKIFTKKNAGKKVKVKK